MLNHTSLPLLSAAAAARERLERESSLSKGIADMELAAKQEMLQREGARLLLLFAYVRAFVCRDSQMAGCGL